MTDFAFDRTARTYDEEGRLRVKLTNISKATVNPYRGSEIPNAAALGLDADRIYYLLRDPQELAKAATSFAGVQLLDQHIPVSADAPQRNRVVGSVGTDVSFDGQYLRASLMVFDADAVRSIETHEIEQLSAAYRYDADMTPGDYQGQRYDGVMRNIRGNHVALVERGRAGPDVVVKDQAMAIATDALDTEARKELSDDDFAVPGQRKLPIENEKHIRLAWDMLDDTDGLSAEEKAHARTRIMHAAKSAGIDTKGWEKSPLATDSQKDVAMTKREEAAKDPRLAKLLPFIAADADLDKLREAVAKDDEDKDKDKDEDEKKKAAAKKVAEDDDDDDDDKKKPAMDALIGAAVTAAVKSATTGFNAAREAERAVRPFVGDVFGLDSADAIYRHALDQLGVKVEGVHPSAYRAILDAQPRPGAAPRNPLAMDAAANKSFTERFPGVARIRSA